MKRRFWPVLTFSAVPSQRLFMPSAKGRDRGRQLRLGVPHSPYVEGGRGKGRQGVWGVLFNIAGVNPWVGRIQLSRMTRYLFCNSYYFYTCRYDGAGIWWIMYIERWTVLMCFVRAILHSLTTIPRDDPYCIRRVMGVMCSAALYVAGYAASLPRHIHSYI